MTRRLLGIWLAAAILLSGGLAQAEGADWRGSHATFADHVLNGDDAKAATLGDTFIDDAAKDLGYHNPEFARVALEVGTAHMRVGNFDRAADLIGQAHAAFVFAQGYANREAFDALALLAEVRLDAEKLDHALRLYQECITVSVIGGYTADQPGLLIGLTEIYDKLDPRIAGAIRQSPAFPNQE